MVSSAPFPNRPFSLQVDTAYVQQSIPDNASYFYAWARIHKDAYSPTFSNDPVSGWEVVGPNGQLGAASNLTFDFRNGTDFYIWSGYFWVVHNPDGTFPGGSVNAYANYAILGYTAVGQALPEPPRIPRGPRVNAGGTWRNTIAYVNAGGTWRIAIPYVNSGGNWRIGGS
jgi:hypothetical protein